MGNKCWFLVSSLVFLLSTAAVTHQNGGCWTRDSDQWNKIDITLYNCTCENFGDLSTENFDPHRTYINLIHLFLAKNKIRSVKHDVFHHLKKLKFLVLSGNLIRSLDERIFSNLNSLQLLDLSFNHLSLLSDGLFSSQEHLETLLLNGNKLITVSVRLLTPLSSITLLDLSNNPLICDCELRLAVFWCKERMLESKATCQNQLSGYVSQWTELEFFNNCSKNQVPYVLTKSVTHLTHSDEMVVADTFYVVLFIVGAVALQVACFGLFLLYLRRQRRSSVSTVGEERSVQSDSSSGQNYQYDYIQIPNIYMPPQLPARHIRTTGNLGQEQADTCDSGVRLKEPTLSGTNTSCDCCEEGHHMTQPEGKKSHHNNHQVVRSGSISASVSYALREYKDPSKTAVSNGNNINTSSDTGVVIENALYSAADTLK